MEIMRTLKIVLTITIYYYRSFDISKRLIKAGIFLVADIGVNEVDQSLYGLPFSLSGWPSQPPMPSHHWVI